MQLNLDLLAKPNETINEHTEHVLSFGRLLLDRHDQTIDKLTDQLPAEFFRLHRDREEVKDFILEVIRFHDYGKVNPSFQSHIKGESREEPFKRKHALYSFYLWATHNQQEGLSDATLALRSQLAYSSIAGHHNRLHNLKDDVSDQTLKQLSESVHSLVTWDVFTEDESDDLVDFLYDMKDFVGDTPHVILLFFSKFIFSMLVTSDSFASGDLDPAEYEKLVPHFFGRSIQETPFSERIDHTPHIRTARSSGLQAADKFSEQPDLNHVRTLLNIKSANAYHPDTQIYILEAPVGTGKTISSLALADEIVRHEQKKKIFSVFPLNSVQTQYVETMERDVKLDPTLMNVVNSDSLFGLEQQVETDFHIHPSNLWLMERNCFSAEFNITSHVRFFDTVSCIRRKDALGFLNLKDSVVILDEFQNYPPNYWFGIWHELLLLSDMMNVTWVFTSGTFPVSEKQLDDLFGDRIRKVLTKQENQELFQSPFIKNRCFIERLDPERELHESLSEVAAEISEDIQQQITTGHHQFIVCANFVDTAKTLYQELEAAVEGFQLYFLCGRHSPSYKRKLVERIHHHHAHPEDLVILVTTKTVECGMDFDFDYGYKEFDLFDSVEQLSGRINRSNRKSGNGLKLFRTPRWMLEIEKFYTRDNATIDAVNEKEFIQLYEDMYQRNKIPMDQYQARMIQRNTFLEYSEYRKDMTIIEDTDYSTEILLVQNHQEPLFLSEFSTPIDPTETYADKFIASMKLRKELEPYRMTVTNKWLQQQVNDTLIECEIHGMIYYLLADDDQFDELIETYQLEGVTSFLEKNPTEEKTYEFY